MGFYEESLWKLLTSLHVKNKAMSKKYLILLSFFSFIFFSSVFAEGEQIELSCEYETEIEVCVSANAGWNAREISDFVCPTTDSMEEIAYQVVLDKEFKKVDEKMDAYITQLDAEKDRYFWPNAKENVLDGINEIESKFSELWDFWVEYNNLCNQTILNKTMQCLPWWKTATVMAKDYLTEWLCEKVYLHKLEVYKMTAYKILQLNKSQVRKDNKKEFFQERRTKYDAIYDAMMVNLGYLERVWRKWKSKIKYN